MSPPPSLTGAHLPFSEMGIIPLLDDWVMDISIFSFNELKHKIIDERRRYYPNDTAHPLSINTKYIIVSNTRNNLKEVNFVVATQKNTNFLMQERDELKKELAPVK